MYVLITDKKMKITSTLSMVDRKKIKIFSSMDNIISIYADPASGLVLKGNALSISLLSKIQHNLYDRNYLYTTDMSQQELVIAKMGMPHGCKVFVSSYEFINNILPSLDLMLITTSHKPGVEMDVWVPNEDAKVLASYIDPIKAKLENFSELMRRTVKLYNLNAPETITVLQKQLKRINLTGSNGKEQYFRISRLRIAQEIRLKLIEQNIKRYSVAQTIADNELTQVG